MAKKTTKAKSSGPLSFQDLAKKLSAINPESEILTKDSKSIQINNWLSTGNYMLNALISGSIFKGIPEGRITILAGEEACLPAEQKIKVYISKKERKKSIEKV